MVDSYSVSGSTHFVTYPERSEKSFDMDPLINMPDDINGIICYTYRDDPYDDFIDYGAYYEKSFILHEDVLGPFLVNLKVHLISFQVCLGEIESWIREAHQNIDYLEATFNMKVEMPGESEALIKECYCPKGTHPSWLICEKCKLYTFKHHSDSKDNKCPGSAGGYGDTFHCKKSQQLKSYKLVDGKIEMTFRIADENGRKKLEKVLELMSI